MADSTDVKPEPTPVVVHVPQPSIFRSWPVRLLMFGLMLSIFTNISFYSQYRQYFQAEDAPKEKFRSGNKQSSQKLLVMEFSGTIMPPFTERWIKQIEHATKDDSIKGVLLEIDSPGGLVADSHQIYHKLLELRAKKPVFVQMKRIAASGGYYIAMGAGTDGRIFAEPTTWTGSIGVIIPRYDVSELVRKLGVAADPLKTGEFKDALSPFHPLSENERKVWESILNQTLDQFMDVIDTNRGNLTLEQVRTLATGQVFTAKDALANGLVDEIGFTEQSLQALAAKANVTDPRIVTYQSSTSLVDMLVNGQAQHANGLAAQMEAFASASVPRAYALCSWWPSVVTPVQ